MGTEEKDRQKHRRPKVSFVKNPKNNTRDACPCDEPNVSEQESHIRIAEVVKLRVKKLRSNNCHNHKRRTTRANQELASVDFFVRVECVMCQKGRGERRNENHCYPLACLPRRGRRRRHRQTIQL